MNTEHLRKSLKTLWLSYYRTHRDWLVKLGVWVNCEGQRRPSSSFILATLATLEPDLLELLPLIVDLSSNPDRIVIALGLNFNPDEALEELEAAYIPAQPIRLLPSQTDVVNFSPIPQNAIDRPAPAQPDDACEGVGPNPNLRYERTN
ncbi:DUF5331 domain-containing protein [Leptolyngbya sp. FACHB-711]|uniref:DUF5331 domain-containing protein n=1 Tax=unclassified Leptolyngbya TaxID=2650499 RepID=UPI00168991B5|nr:hypothetical protein [Cyanobacteria bacterium FACHB-502]MBD2027648.1 hypothetical protein [Leptolyngbya sp. FACHB-711]